MQVRAVRVLLMALIPLFAGASSSALSPDPRLLALVPPGSQIVAGMAAPQSGGQPGSFLLVTRNNTTDLQDFFALTGSDESHTIHQVILTAAADQTGNLTEHSLLASGHFDQPRVFQSAGMNGASQSKYRGIPVLVVPPFERERSTLKDMRWFVVLGSDLVLFGTLATVQLELDRHLDGSASDPSIVQRLNRIRRNDEIWCLLAALAHGDEIHNALGELNPALAEMVENGGAFEFGIHYGAHVEFEYEVTASSNASAKAVSQSLAISLGGPTANPSPLLLRPGIAKDSSVVHGVVKVSRLRYEAWLAEISASTRTRIPARSP
jgi:hypothetical protein